MLLKKQKKNLITKSFIDHWVNYKKDLQEKIKKLFFLIRLLLEIFMQKEWLKKFLQKKG